MFLNFYTIDYEPQNGSGQPAVFLTENINWNKYSSTSSLNEVSHSVSNMTLSTQETSSQEISLVGITISHFMSKEDSSFQEIQPATTTVSHFVSTQEANSQEASTTVGHFVSTQEANSQEASTTVGHFVSKTSIQETVFKETAKYFISTSLVIKPTPTLMSTPLLRSSSQGHILSTTFAIMPSTSDISSLQSISTFVVYSSKDVTTKRNQPTPVLLPPITSGIDCINKTNELNNHLLNYPNMIMS